MKKWLLSLTLYAGVACAFQSDTWHAITPYIDDASTFLREQHGSLLMGGAGLYALYYIGYAKYLELRINQGQTWNTWIENHGKDGFIDEQLLYTKVADLRISPNGHPLAAIHAALYNLDGEICACLTLRAMLLTLNTARMDFIFSETPVSLDTRLQNLYALKSHFLRFVEQTRSRYKTALNTGK